MKRPPANTSPEARALREAATEWVTEPGRGLFDLSDPEDTIGQRRNVKLLNAAVAYAKAVEREGTSPTKDAVARLMAHPRFYALTVDRRRQWFAKFIGAGIGEFGFSPPCTSAEEAADVALTIIESAS